MPALTAAPGRLRSLDRATLCEAGLAAVIGLRVALGDYRGLADQPEALFRPVPFLRWLDGMPSAEVFVIVQAVAGVAAAAAVVGALRGRRRRGALLVAWAGLVVLAGLRGSLGKVLHNDVLVVLTTIPFLLAEDEETSSGRSAPAPWAPTMALALMATAYFCTGYWKLRNSGLAWVTSDNLRYVMAWGAASGKPQYPGLAATVAALPVVCHFLAAATLLFELTFAAVLVWPRLRPAYLAGSVALHVGTWLLLGLDYWSYMAVAFVLLVPLRRRPTGQPAPDPALLAAGIAHGPQAQAVGGS